MTLTAVGTFNTNTHTHAALVVSDLSLHCITDAMIINSFLVFDK